MRAIDTNVLIRLITGDDSKQAEAAGRFIENGAWVSTLALAETTWVLETWYKRSAPDIASAIQMLIEHRDLILQDSDAVALALELFRARPARGFSDCLIFHLARKAGHLPLGTFDRALGKIEGAQALRLFR